MISLFVFCLSISSRSSCSRAFNRKAAMDEDRRSFGGDDPPLFVLAADTAGDSGGDDVVFGLAKNSWCIPDGLPPGWCAECCAAEILANSDWNEALGEYKPPTPSGNIWGCGALYGMQICSMLAQIMEKTDVYFYSTGGCIATLLIVYY